ncbi:MAG: ribonuclease III [Rhizobiaceae bacterium]|nr:ribonuclease III [Rhizobiaceae bacterium]
MARRKQREEDDRTARLAAATGHAFRDPWLADGALTHASARGASRADYQRLEFLGDRVLGLCIAEMLYAAFPDAPEGELSVRLNALVNAEALAEIADEAAISELIRSGSDVRALSARNRVNLRADAVEALIAALYLDGGLDAARAFIRRWWQPRGSAAAAPRRDPKTELQEWAHQVSAAAPAYETVSRDGPDHDPVFTVVVKVPGKDAAEATGRSKRQAEQNAAAALLLREGVWQAEIVE